MKIAIRTVLLTLLISVSAFVGSATTAKAQPQNVVFILSDDHRYDFMDFHVNAPEFLRTPSMDRMAAEGMHVENSFVTTSLCSPSRASILTGQYAHRHGVVDNQQLVPEGTRFFPEDLQEAGYQTAFVGKWHMGASTDRPRPGFDHWVSFRGQGPYRNPTFNVNGEQVPREGYTTDLLTEYAVDWLRQQDGDEPFLLYLSHKAVHSDFEPADRHAGRYADVDIPYPPSMANIESNYRTKPDWVREQRYGWHGVAYPYQGQLDFDATYRRYAEALLALDESIGRVLDYLQESGLDENTLVIYMSDNGFMLGEHGLIDKRQAYEESIRVPMLAWAPGYIDPGTVTSQMVRNIDIAPTLFDLAGMETPDRMNGRSFLPALEGQEISGDAMLLYEYYWEYPFPHTPTVFALRGDRYKFMFYHGVWDKNEFYDLQTDPREMYNLIDVPRYQEMIRTFERRLWERLEETGGMKIPLKPMGGWQADERLRHE